MEAASQINTLSKTFANSRKALQQCSRLIQHCASGNGGADWGLKLR